MLRHKNFRCFVHNKFFEVNLYQKDPVNKHHWRATIARPAKEIDIPTRHKEPTLAEVVKRKDSTPNIMPEFGGTKFSEDLVFATLSMALPGLAVNFSGDLLCLSVLDVLASKVNAPVNFDPAWMKLLNAANVARFIIHCGNGYGSSPGAQAETLVGPLELMAIKSLERNVRQPCRARLGEVLRDMPAQLSHDAEGKRDLLGMIGHALDVVDNGPNSHFRIDPPRNAPNLASSSSDGIQGMELRRKQLGDRCNQYLASESIFTPEPKPSDTDLNLRTLSDSDDGERRDDYDDFNDDRWSHGDGDYKDFTACDKECGYCGHCDY
jgi:hypothetical protein